MSHSLCRLLEKKESEMRRAELEAYLLAEIRSGHHYFKSSDVAKATGFSANRVGTNFALMQTYSDVLDIVRWSRSCSSSVWKITEKSSMKPSCLVCNPAVRNADGLHEGGEL